jgi:hypothetical protein
MGEFTNTRGEKEKTRKRTGRVTERMNTMENSGVEENLARNDKRRNEKRKQRSLGSDSPPPPQTIDICLSIKGNVQRKLRLVTSGVNI